MHMPIVDTHLHLVYRDRLSYPWLADVAPLDRDFHYETYAAEARRCGITDVLHMEVDVAPGDIEAETRNVADIALQSGSLLRGAISSCRPEDDGFRRLSRAPARKSFRQRVSPRPARRSRRAKRGRRRSATTCGDSADAGRPFDLCVRADQIDKAIALADIAPGVQFVLDHCGVPAIKDRARASMAREDRRNREAPERRGQGFGRRGLRRSRRRGRSTTSDPMSSTRSRVSAGTASSGAATGRSAR